MKDTGHTEGSASAPPGAGAESAARTRAGDGGSAAAGAAADPDGLAARYRDEFPILSSTVYLNSTSLGALSRRSIEARRRFEREWHARGARAWHESWLEELERVRRGFGRTVGAAEGEIALVPSVSAALAAVAGALDFGDRPRVVVTDLDFPTLAHQFLARRRLGVEVVTVESPDGIEVPPGRIAEAVDERTRLVATSHVYYTTGAVQDAAAVAEIAHDAGALFLLDAYQSVGQLPVDARSLAADFVVSGALKWLMGGPGLAFLWARRELADRLSPTTLSWFGVEDQFAFDPGRAEPRPGARRFEMGTPAVGAAFTAAGGLSLVEEIGAGAIRERNAALAEDLLGRLRAAGFEPLVAPDPDRRSAIVCVQHPEPERAVERLAERGVVVDARPGRVRISPHFYNTVDDNARAVEALAAAGVPG